MKPWMAIVVVIVALALGLWLMTPDARKAPSGGGATGAESNTEKIATISKGERVEIAQHLRDGRFTIVEFTADW